MNYRKPYCYYSNGKQYFKKREQKQISKGYGLPKSFKPSKNRNYEQINDADIEEGLPYFLSKENIKDKNGNRPGDKDYDCTTLYVPEKYMKYRTPAMKQYWKLKSENYDKILLFKLGKFYELFYEDAIIGNRHLDLNWMGSIKKLHVGFPEKALNKYLGIIVNLGYKAAVVEQMETPRMRNKRMQSNLYYTPKVVMREICNIYSKGTFINPFKTSYDSRWVLAFTSDFERNIGVVFFDISTLKLNVGQFKDDEMYNKFRMLCSQLRPIEIIYDKDKHYQELIRILDNSPNPPAKSDLPSFLCGNSFACLTKLEKYFSMDKSKWPKSLIEILLKMANCEMALTSLGMTISYLQKSMLDEQVIQLATYQMYDPDKIKSSKMILDAQALEQLHILDIPGGTEKENTASLFQILDQTCTKFGKRSFKRWVTTPLCSIQMINERLDAIEDLMYHPSELEKFRQNLSTLPDLEKKLSTIYQYSITQNKKAIYFENINRKRLTEFYSLIDILKNVGQIVEPLVTNKATFMSKRLKQLLTIRRMETEEMEQKEFEELDDDKGVLPDVSEEMEEFEQMIEWKTDKEDKPLPQPKDGLDKEFDAVKQRILGIEDRFYDYLVTIQKRYNDISIRYTHTKYRYELEIPEKHTKGTNKPPEYEFTSSRKGFHRFHTPEIRELVEELEAAEEAQNEALVPFICSIFSHFYSKKEIWDRLTSCLSELDCLCSLACVSMDEKMVMNRPQFIDFEQNKFHSYLELRNMRHPGVEATGVDFVPNDTIVGKRYDLDEDIENQPPSTLLISGPNMGGKSTLLRQTCLAVIMAQLGCYVPAETCVLTPIDRIFTRIGASDCIFEGKSVFFTEMEETKQIIDNATSQSLVIMDELGRGTSTFDGFSIAKASLNYIHKSIKCLCLFTTHYHMLTKIFDQEYDIKNYHMGYEEDPEEMKIKFLYKLTKGRCKQSFGIQVAKITGLPEEILYSAREKSKELSYKLQLLTEDIKRIEK
ncbi:unnamed protein product [Moneuplotes crassus]|uniref:DNA mismatch repair proteins mutS family domain-containing protein n=1 Tax=Euplotes crassus TaxID=5936 RepID=A0AAD1UQ51_EUPCR|nr:unnamed protein product [Moneuplotes crassus]